MTGLQTTSWGLIEAAARGDEQPRDEFARRYQSFVREVLGARWRGSPLLVDLDDAVQEVFFECLRQGGGLQRAEPDRGARFRSIQRKLRYPWRMTLVTQVAGSSVTRPERSLALGSRFPRW